MEDVALRILGASVALLLGTFVFVRFRRGQMRRAELLLAWAVVAGLLVAASTPNVFDPLLSILGFERGQERRIIGLLVISNLLALGLIFRGISRDQQLSNEVGDLVDSLALRRLHDEGWTPPRGACAVVIPAHNEADNIAWVLNRIPKEVLGHPVVALVVADGCTDDTEQRVRQEGVAVIRRDLRRGSGAAARIGYRAAVEAGARVVVTLDADGQHDPHEIERLLEPILAGRADMVQGSRVLGSYEVESRARARGIAVFARVLSALARTSITDPSTGYRALSADALRGLNLKQDQFYVSEVILDAARKGLRVEEVPITLRRRAGGTTKKPATMRYAWGFSKAALRTWLR